MGQEPEVIRQEIEATREEMGQTVDAIGYKADVKSRTRESIAEKKDAVKSRLTGAGGRANESTPSAGDVKQGAQRAAGVAQENPIGLAIGGVAIGFLAGMVVPSSRVENEKLGPTADQVKEKAMETGHEAVERGKQVAQETAQSAKEAAKESGQEQAEQLRSSAEQNASDARREA